jgi:hypothetical protein
MTAALGPFPRKNIGGSGMAYFVKLTSTSGDRPIFVNVDAIVTLQVLGTAPGKQHTRIHSGESNGDFNVKETPSQIMAMLDKSRTSGL